MTDLRKFSPKPQLHATFSLVLDLLDIQPTSRRHIFYCTDSFAKNNRLSNMGKENINFLTAWIILGNVFATFSTDPEPTAISNSTGSPTEFGKSGTSTSTSLSSLLPLQEIMRRTHTDLRLIAERCFALTENNLSVGLQTCITFHAIRAAAGASLLSAKLNFSIQTARSSVQQGKERK